MIQSRQYPRRNLQTEILVILSSGRTFKGKSLNISEGGMMISCERAGVTLGQKIFIEVIGDLRFRLGFISGEVVHYRSDSLKGEYFQLFGLKFTQLTSLQRDVLKSLFPDQAKS